MIRWKRLTLAACLAIPISASGDKWPSSTALVMREAYLECIKEQAKDNCIRMTADSFFNTPEELEYAVFGEVTP